MRVRYVNDIHTRLVYEVFKNYIEKRYIYICILKKPPLCLTSIILNYLQIFILIFTGKYISQLPLKKLHFTTKENVYRKPQSIKMQRTEIVQPKALDIITKKTTERL